MAWLAKAATLGQQRAVFFESGDPASSNVIVLIHAFPVGMRMWDVVSIPVGWRAIAPALPGFDGVDPPPTAAASIDDYARYVLELLDHLRVVHAVIGGVSMGGYTAFALWRLNRLRWRGVVLADTRAGADSEQARVGREKMLETLRTGGSRAIADEMVPKLLGKTTRSKRPDVVDHATRLIERQTSEGLAAAVVRLRDRPDSAPLLSEMGVPALVVVGEEDEVTPVSESEQMHARLPDSRLVRIPEAGHLSCMENPVAFSAALASFLSEIRG
jgi:pimeloyl-ACP methyl ester carboxylesterase